MKTIDTTTSKCTKTYTSEDNLFIIHMQWLEGQDNSFYLPKLYEQFNIVFPEFIEKNTDFAMWYAVSTYTFTRPFRKERWFNDDAFFVFLNEPDKDRKSEKNIPLSIEVSKTEATLTFDNEKFRELLLIHQNFLYDKILKKPRPKNPEPRPTVPTGAKDFWKNF